MIYQKFCLKQQTGKPKVSKLLSSSCWVPTFIHNLSQANHHDDWRLLRPAARRIWREKVVKATMNFSLLLSSLSFLSFLVHSAICEGNLRTIFLDCSLLYLAFPVSVSFFVAAGKSNLLISLEKRAPRTADSKLIFSWKIQWYDQLKILNNHVWLLSMFFFRWFTFSLILIVRFVFVNNILEARHKHFYDVWRDSSSLQSIRLLMSETHSFSIKRTSSIECHQLLLHSRGKCSLSVGNEMVEMKARKTTNWNFMFTIWHHLLALFTAPHGGSDAAELRWRFHDVFRQSADNYCFVQHF